MEDKIAEILGDEVLLSKYLRPGHCEVHPHVHECYPCSVCLEEARERDRYEAEYAEHCREEYAEYCREQYAEYCKEQESASTCDGCQE